MALRTKICIFYSPNAAYLLACALLGVAIVNNILLLGLLSLLVQYLWFKRFIRLKADRRVLLTIFFGSVVFMMSIMSWYRFIDAHGWSTIMGLPPSAVLMTASFMISLACSALVTIIWWLIHQLYPESTPQNSVINVLGWATLFVIAELAVSAGFSLLTTHTEAPVAPTWNIFSAALLTTSTPLISIGRVMGFWGTTWVLCAIIALLAEVILNRSRLRPVTISAIGLSGLLLGVAAAYQPTSSDNQILGVVAVSNQSRVDYLKELPSRIRLADAPTVVVLPEYSALLHPFGGSPAGLGHDVRYTFPEIFGNRPIYFVGTENEQSDGRNYVETYIVNGSLEKVKRQVKTFLVPGGEYIVPWLGGLIGLFDKEAVQNFDQNRSRIVISKQLSPQTMDGAASNIGVGPCSTLMLPYHFRNEVNKGAHLLTSNVSYEQFLRAPEYERFATRLARFHAVALDRWMIVGANYGNALIINPEGNIAANAKGGEVAMATAEARNSRTLYSIAGDRLIIGTLAATFLFLVVVRRIRNDTPVRIESTLSRSRSVIRSQLRRFHN